MQDPQTLEDARAAEQMMQAVDELAERTDEVERLRQALKAAQQELTTTRQELGVARQALQAAQQEALAPPPEPAVVLPPELGAADPAMVEELRQKNEQLLRVAADFQNYKRRIETERPRWRAEGKAEGIRPILNVLDDLQRALDAMGEDAPEAIRTGIEGVVRNFENALKTIGVVPIEAVGEPFNTHLHEAIAHPPATDDQVPGTVVAEARRGYRMGDQVLRHSQVVVAG
jgi:molecular chaperone GrpE